MRKGGAFRLTGLILGIVGSMVSICAIVFSAVGLLMGKKFIQPKVHK